MRFSRFPPVIFQRPFQEQPRLRQAEPVYALLHVPHQEQAVSGFPFAAGGQATDNLILHPGNILAFIHEDFGIPPAHRGTGRLRTQDLQRPVFQVIEVQQAELRLSSVVFFRSALQDFLQPLQGSPHVSEFPFHGFRILPDQ